MSFPPTVRSAMYFWIFSRFACPPISFWNSLRKALCSLSISSAARL
eukprot:CAMPEP_0206277116 /NCGR_PEP_ID=MMETSP0047_2-20121206/36687_1 /ASSEMBLY_ACC=CAM_ASM_000192 /TAXON_ID=195065 /ORGANISM="Chroomonas mesostigmatica_cf, Strain CCMP1168" /LENGTH=45 /DNA_ID= /DNA_START= /DNA_END= /DNA_ORIENTATION=